MKNTFSLLICFAILFSACSSDTSDGSTEIKKKVDETPLVQRYMTEMIANPKNQDDLDRNIIVNKLIDNLWEFKKTDSGIYYKIDPPGTGGHPNLNSNIKCHYKGTLLDGREFDSSFKRNKPLEFTLGQVIAGWQEAIPLLEKGGKGTFIVPSRLAYGQSFPPGTIITANSILMFEIELLDFH